MLSYKIISKQLSHPERQQHNRRHINPTDKDFHEKILERVFSKLSFKEGQHVQIRGTPKRGTIVKIHFDHDSIIWQGNKPLFIEILLDEKTRTLCGTHQLRRKK